MRAVNSGPFRLRCRPYGTLLLTTASALLLTAWPAVLHASTLEQWLGERGEPTPQAQNENPLLAPVLATGAIPRQAGQPTPLIIVVSPPLVRPSTLPKPETYVLLSHLPADTLVSQGQDLGDGTWRISLDELAELKVTIPAEHEGTASLSVTAVSDYGEGRVSQRTEEVAIPMHQAAGTVHTISEQSIIAMPVEALAMRSVPPPAPVQPQAKPVVATPNAGPAPKPDAVPVQTLIKRGDALFALGDLAGARLFYEMAASAGSGPAALALGKTYDPLIHERLRVRGLAADPEQAATWYRRAIGNGSGEAERPLTELSAWMARKGK